MQVWLRRLSLVLAVLVVSSVATLVPVEGPAVARAQPEPARGRPDTDGTVSLPTPVVNGPRSPRPAPEVSVTLSEDGRTVTRSDVADLVLPAEAVGPGDVEDTVVLLPEDVVRPVPPGARPSDVPGRGQGRGF